MTTIGTCIACWSNVSWARQMHRVVDIGLDFELLPSDMTHVCDSSVCHRADVRWSQTTNGWYTRVESSMNATHVAIIDHTLEVRSWADADTYRLETSLMKNATHVLLYVFAVYHVSPLIEAPGGRCVLPFPTTRDISWCDKAWSLETTNYSVIVRPLTSSPMLYVLAPPAFAGQYKLTVTTMMSLNGRWQYALRGTWDEFAVIIVMDVGRRGAHVVPSAHKSHDQTDRVIGMLIEIDLDAEDIVSMSPSKQRTQYPFPTTSGNPDLRVFWIPVACIIALCCGCVIFKCLCLVRDASVLTYQEVPA